MLGRVGALVIVVAAAGCGGRAAVNDAGPRDSGYAGDCHEWGLGGCTQMGCPAVTGMSGASQLVVGLAVPIAAPMGDLQGSEVTGCRNDVCVTGTLQTSPLVYQNPFAFPANDTHIEANVRDPVADAGPVLEVGWGRNTNVSPWCLLPDPRDGDRYSVEMKTPANVVVATASGTATYKVTYPNERGNCCPNGTCCTPACCVGTFAMTPDGGVDH